MNRRRAGETGWGGIERMLRATPWSWHLAAEVLRGVGRG